MAARTPGLGLLSLRREHPRLRQRRVPERKSRPCGPCQLRRLHRKVYDHAHAGCRVFQYTSAKLAHQLGADDADGRVNIIFEGDSGTYNPAAVRVILVDLYDRLGADTRGC